jgi:signal peptidase II
LSTQARGRSLFAVIAVVVFILDRVSKGLVNANVEFGHEVSAIPGLVWIANTRNSGAAFGVGQSGSLVFMLASIVVAAAIAWYVARNQLDLPTLAILGLVFGGTVGNGYDRLFHGGEVTDFISLHWFPIFNVADSAITVGVILLLLGYALRQRSAA